MPTPARSRSVEAPPDTTEQVHKALADANAFRRVRLYNKALDTLRAGLDIDPRSMDIHEVYRDILIESGQTDDAVQEMLVIAALYIDSLDGESAARALQDVLAFDPQNARAIEMLQELGYEIVDENEETSALAAAAGQLERRLRGRSCEPSTTSRSPPTTSKRRPRGGRAAVRRRPAGLRRPRGVAGSSQHDDPGRRRRAPELPARRAGRRHAAGLRRCRTEQSARTARPPARAVEPTERPRAPSAGVRRRPPAAPRRHRSHRRTRGRAASSRTHSTRRSSSARAVSSTTRARSSRSSSPSIRTTRSSASESPSSTRRTSSAAAARASVLATTSGGGDRAYDIAASLDALESLDYNGIQPAEGHANTEQQVDVEEVFAKFKEGVAKQISVDDSDSHYNLGIAYKEMMLIDDAIREFEVAAQDPKRECVCRSMIGMIEIERGRLNEAIDAFLHGPQLAQQGSAAGDGALLRDRRRVRSEEDEQGRAVVLPEGDAPRSELPRRAGARASPREERAEAAAAPGGGRRRRRVRSRVRRSRLEGLAFFFRLHAPACRHDRAGRSSARGHRGIARGRDPLLAR